MACQDHQGYLTVLHEPKSASQVGARPYASRVFLLVKRLTSWGALNLCNDDELDASPPSSCQSPTQTLSHVTEPNDCYSLTWIHSATGLIILKNCPCQRIVGFSDRLHISSSQRRSIVDRHVTRMALKQEGRSYGFNPFAKLTSRIAGV